MKSKPIYVEIEIESDMERVWEYTQNPSIHEQWDLRFSEISYLPKAKEEDLQKFLYKTNIGFGLSIAGEGESVKTIQKDNERMSSLKFWTNHPLSLIREGSGYWKYVQTESGIQFFTQYDYRTRFGLSGKMIDILFKPLIGWATAWSFDCLRIWIEKEIPPRISLLRTMYHFIISFVLAFIWIYQGLVPKILHQEAGELALLKGTGLFQGNEVLFLYGLGIGQIVFGLLFLWINRQKWLHLVNIAALLALGVGAYFSQGVVFAGPFNLPTITVAVVGYSVIALLNLQDLPSASRCKRRR
ncbi:DoxX-like family protein [Bacillus alkalicellulosilyticus]|uniref:DoxX-like family protein n=1 Tax=Alkalihalobacterium alkalicellulosilyticum TaxID=1912214 RepID=UPI00099761A3|nr:DoxX-like family protein [Bacillus alkalicellulosilyticus]